MAQLTRFERGCVVVLVGAALVRIAFILEPNFIWDSAWFLMLARSFGETGTFLIRWSDPASPEFSGYWPPLFPVFASLFVKVFGPSPATLVLASSVAAALLVAAVFFTTRDLFDRPRAFAAAALVAASPAFYASDARGMSESLLGLMIVLTLWAFLRSLSDPRWLPVAGLFAFLAYLGKASLGLPFVAAGLAALAAWRIHRRGWRAVVRSPMDVGVALAGVAIVVALMLTRTERVGGVGLGLIEPLRRGVMNADCGELAEKVLMTGPWPSHTGPHCWAIAFPLKILFVCVFLLVITLPLSLRLRHLLREPRTERTDAMWLAVILPTVAGAVFTTTFFFTEHRAFVDFDNIRYLTPAIVPFIWLLLPFWSFEDEPAGKDERIRDTHARWYWIAVGAMVIVLLLNPLVGAFTLPRFFGLVVLSLIPIAIAMVARATRYAIRERRVPGGIERRYAREPPPSAPGRALVAAGVLLAVAGLLYSSWYASLALGLVVVASTSSPARRAIAMALVLLASAAPAVHTVTPVEDAARAMAALPEGSVVAVNGQIVFPAAVSPDHVRVRPFDLAGPPPAHVDAILAQNDASVVEYDGFTRVASWDYAIGFFPTVAARVWLEENVLGWRTVVEQERALSLYVRNGTAAP